MSRACSCGVDAGLTDSDMQIILALANGAEVEEIAARLEYTPATVNTYITRLRLKLGARHRAHLVGQAFARGLVRVGCSGEILPAHSEWVAVRAAS